jgi:DNA-directed RNA polymerase specialized sigma24 family protein
MTFTRKHREPAQAGLSAARQEAPDFEALFQQHWTRLCWVLFRLVGDWPEAEDLALDAFDRLYRRPQPGGLALPRGHQPGL